jgi:hypothetical protein
MKKLLYLISMMLLMTSCSLFEFDNYEDYNASISGTFKDVTTGENVQQECVYSVIFGGVIGSYTTGYISAFQKGWDYEAAQNWLVKSDGTYLNSNIFAGTYRIEAKEDNFYPVIKDDVIISKGSNTVDWTVTPYVRIIDPSITYDASVSKFKATFKCQYGDPTKANTIYKAVFCIYPDVFVGMSLNNCSSDPEGSKTGGLVVADGTTINTLYINPAFVSNGHTAEFKYSRTHYLRIAVCATGTGINSSFHYNFSPIVSIHY